MASGRLNLNERLEYAAEFGKFFIFLTIWKKDIKELRKHGITVEEQYPTKNSSQFYCRISWEFAEPPVGENVELNQANRLWLSANNYINLKMEKFKK